MALDQAFEISGQETAQVLHVHNLLSESLNKEILQAVQTRIEEGFSNFVIDLKEAPFINSVGLNLLIHIMLRAKEGGGNLVIANASAKVLQLLEVTKLKSMFLLAPDVEAAVHLFSTNE